MLRRDDRGFTLIELLIVVVILGVIVGPLAGGLIVFLRNSDATVTRMNESHDAQIAAAYFAQDVDSMGKRDWTTSGFPMTTAIETGVGTTYACGGDAVVRFIWDDPSGPSGTPREMRVAYVDKTVGGERQLHRMTCVGNSTVVSDLVLAHNLDPNLTKKPELTCPTTLASCTGATVPQVVNLKLYIRNPATTGSALEVFLTGQRRQS